VGSTLPSAIARGLGDKNYEKRKNSAHDITGLIKNLQDLGDNDKVAGLIAQIVRDFVESKNSNFRKGGLIGLAAVAIGLSSDIDKFLHTLVPPVLQCFDDQEARVCYYACESMYNIVKVARGGILEYFNPIFDGVCSLFDHGDTDVKNGAILLDKLIRDIVIETKTIDIEAIIPLLKSQITKTKPYIRQLLVGWIMVLKAVPNIHLLDFLPDFLGGLFDMLGDSAQEIREAAGNALTSFVADIRDADIVEFGPMIKILMEEAKRIDPANRLTALAWLMEFMKIAGVQLLPFYSDLLQCIIQRISDEEADVRGLSMEANTLLRMLVCKTTENFPLRPLLGTLTAEMLSSNVQTRIAALDWMSMLYEKSGDTMNTCIDEVLPAVLRALSDSSDEVMLVSLEVLAHVCTYKEKYEVVLRALVQLFREDRPLLEARGNLIIRKLCALLDWKVYLTFAEILEGHENKNNFLNVMIQTLNLILLTAPELLPLRNRLKTCFQESSSSENRKSFDKIFKCWSHNAVATFSLCLLAQAYDVSAELIHKFASLEIGVSFLMQIDKLVQLLESPIFVHLRLQLLETNAPNHQDLLKSLYGLLMLLPQSQAYRTLADRLQTVGALQIHLSGSSGSSKGGKTKAAKEEVNNLVNWFDSVQTKHSEARAKALVEKSLKKSSGGTASAKDGAGQSSKAGPS